MWIMGCHTILVLLLKLLQGRIQEFLVGGGGGPNCTQYVETVLQLITSTLR